MKKIFLPLVLIFLLSSCGIPVAKNVSPDFNIDCLMCFDYMQTEYTAYIKTDENGNMSAEIQTPENLKGISVACRSDSITAKCGEVEIECSDGYYPFRELYKAISTARKTEPISTEEQNGEYSCLYKNGNSQYIFVTDESGKIKYINTPMCKFEKR